MNKLPDILHAKNRKIILCFSIIITGRCNAACSYCHFYGLRSRKRVAYDISDELFNIYASLIAKTKKILPSNIEIQCRFSGGEPLILQERLFKLSKIIYDTAHIKPYVLTNGKAINSKFVKLAEKNFINFLAVSLENPLNPDKGAFKPILAMKKIAKYNSNIFPIIPGVSVIRNEDFKNLYKICEIFYKQMKVLPTINELNFQIFEYPTRTQLKELHDNIVKIVRYFYPKTPIKIFPYISPEFCYGGIEHYIIELDLENKHGLTISNFNRKIYQVLNQINISYPKLTCKQKKCEWCQECKRVKWVWKNDFGQGFLSEKLNAYCMLKKTINNAFFDALNDENRRGFPKN